MVPRPSRQPVRRRLAVARAEKLPQRAHRVEAHADEPRQDALAQQRNHAVAGLARNVFARQALAVANAALVGLAAQKNAVGVAALGGRVTERVLEGQPDREHVE